jgi:hypothetical protein
MATKFNKLVQTMTHRFDWHHCLVKHVSTKKGAFQPLPAKGLQISHLLTDNIVESKS